MIHHLQLAHAMLFDWWPMTAHTEGRLSPLPTSCCTDLSMATPDAGNHRKLRVTAQPNVSLTLEHVPQHCRRAKTILLGPLTPTDLDAAAFVHQEHGMACMQSSAYWTPLSCKHSLSTCTRCIMCMPTPYAICIQAGFLASYALLRQTPGQSYCCTDS